MEDSLYNKISCGKKPHLLDSGIGCSRTLDVFNTATGENANLKVKKFYERESARQNHSISTNKELIVTMKEIYIENLQSLFVTYAKMLCDDDADGMAVRRNFETINTTTQI